MDSIWFKKKYFRTRSRIRLVGEGIDSWYDRKIRQPTRDWYDKEFYPEIGRRLVYTLSMDFKGIRKNLRIRNIPKIIRHPGQYSDFLQYFKPLSYVSRQRIDEKIRKKLEGAPAKVVLYRKRAREFAEDNERLRQELANWQNLYSELFTSVEAANARLAAGELKRYEETVKGLQQTNRSLAKSEMELGTRVGEQASWISELEKKELSARQSSLRTREELQKTIEEKKGLEKIISERDRLISLIRKSLHEKEDRFVQKYLKEVVGFIDRHPGAIVLVGPGLEGEIIDASDEAKSILHYNGDLKGKRYSEILDLDIRQKREAVVFFSSPKEQDDIDVPIVYKHGEKERKDKVRIAKLPVMSKIPGEESRHLLSVLSVNSISWGKRMFSRSSEHDLTSRLADEKRTEEAKVTARRVLDETRRAVEGDAAKP